ncbi:MAG: hypothetical protein WCR23_12430, partial [Planctomycetota bacterium]
IKVERMPDHILGDFRFPHLAEVARDVVGNQRLIFVKFPRGNQDESRVISSLEFAPLAMNSLLVFDKRICCVYFHGGRSF